MHFTSAVLKAEHDYIKSIKRFENIRAYFLYLIIKLKYIYLTVCYIKYTFATNYSNGVGSKVIAAPPLNQSKQTDMAIKHIFNYRNFM